MRLRSPRNHSSRNERQVTTNDTAKVYVAVGSTRPYSTQPLYCDNCTTGRNFYFRTSKTIDVDGAGCIIARNGVKFRVHVDPIVTQHCYTGPHRTDTIGVGKVRAKRAKRAKVRVKVFFTQPSLQTTRNRNK
jgi:hypothetical protein